MLPALSPCPAPTSTLARLPHRSPKPAQRCCFHPELPAASLYRFRAGVPLLSLPACLGRAAARDALAWTKPAGADVNRVPTCCRLPQFCHPTSFAGGKNAAQGPPPAPTPLRAGGKRAKQLPPPTRGLRRETAMTAAEPHFFSGGLFLCLGDYPPISPASRVSLPDRSPLQAVQLQGQAPGSGSLRSPPQPPQRQEHLQADTTG